MPISQNKTITDNGDQGKMDAEEILWIIVICEVCEQVRINRNIYDHVMVDARQADVSHCILNNR